MHYCIYLFTKDFPTDERITTIMEPYNDQYEGDDKYDSLQNPNKPDIQWDYWNVGGRYSGMLKLACENNDDTYKWNYYIDNPRAGRLFRCSFLENLIEFRKRNKNGIMFGFYGSDSMEQEYFRCSGIRDGYIHVDGCKISELINLEERLDGGYGFIDDAFGKVDTREWWNRDEIKFVDNPDYDNELKAAFERNKDGYLTIIDIHD